jgi:hypothetical protein
MTTAKKRHPSEITIVPGVTVRLLDDCGLMFVDHPSIRARRRRRLAQALWDAVRP